MQTRWSGVFPAVTTKMTCDGALDVPATCRGIERLVNYGVAGIIVLPMLGEYMSLEAAEREALLRAAVQTVAGRVPVLTGLAEVALEEACRNADTYRSCGADGLMAFPSLGYRTDPRETVHWFRKIAAAGKLPMMIYNNPVAYKVDVTAEILRDLADVPEIVCLKQDTGDIRRLTDTFVDFGDRFSVVCGADDLIVESVAVGAVGWVSGMANAWPAECVRLFDLCVHNRFEEARRLCRVLAPAFHLDSHIKLTQYIKLAEHEVYGAPEWTRPPRLPLVGRERDRVIATIRQTIDDLASS